MSDYLAVIAIDFGTTFSGYAFSMRTKKNDIKMNKNWGADVGFQSYKTPTTLLLRPNGEFQSFGYQAESEFSEMDEDDLKKGYLLFQRFKMELYAHKKLDSKIKIRSTSGVQKTAVDIISDSLKFMKEHATEAISKTLPKPIANNYIRWVITVPAIWSDTAKKFMRLAAKQAELVDDLLSPNLIIALEPEAASLYCRTLSMDKFVGGDGSTENLKMKTGEKYIIVDCGGGTIDITVHEVQADGKVKEVKAPSGGPWGGTEVDKRFFQLLDNVLGTNFMNRLKEKHPATWLSILVDFESKKRAAKPEKKDGVTINIPFNLAEVFKEHSGESIKDRLKKKESLGVKFSNGMIRVDGQTIGDMYTEVLSNTRRHVQILLSETQDVSKIFVVGGFGEAGHMQQMLIDEVGSKANVLVPEDAGMCVMKGAVLFGHDTSSISTRIARFNYGVRLLRVPISTDDKSRIHTQYGEERVATIRRFVSRNHSIAWNETFEYTTGNTSEGQKNAWFRLYSVEEDDTDDPNHQTASFLEEIEIDIPEGTPRKFKIALRFGDTDILMTAADMKTGEEAFTTVQF